MVNTITLQSWDDHNPVETGGCHDIHFIGRVIYGVSALLLLQSEYFIK